MPPSQLNEGTIFSKSALNLGLQPDQEDAALTNFIQSLLIDPSAVTPQTFSTIQKLYPANDTSLGGAFHTGDDLFDRAEAWYTDNMYLSARRLFFQNAAPHQPLFGYFFKEFIPGANETFGGKSLATPRTFVASFDTPDSIPRLGAGIALWSRAGRSRERLREPDAGLLHQFHQ